MASTLSLYSWGYKGWSKVGTGSLHESSFFSALAQLVHEDRRALDVVATSAGVYFPMLRAFLLRLVLGWSLERTSVG